MLDVVWPDEYNGLGLTTAEGEGPESIEIDITWDIGAGASVLSNDDIPGHEIKESKGWKEGWTCH